MSEEKEYLLAMEIMEDNQSTGYSHVNVRFVKYCYGDIDYFWDYDYGKTGMDYNRLYITCQMDDHNSSSYAHRISYDGSCIELPKAERMVKTLKYIEKGLERHERKYGYVEGYADYVIRIANILKVSHFIIKRYNCPDQHEREAKYAKYAIQRIIEENINRLQPKKEV